MCKDEVVGEWRMNGDSFQAYGLTADVNIHSPFFNATPATNQCDSYASYDEYRIQTLRGIDPELSILLSLVCMTEFSMEKIKSSLQLNTPEDSTQYDNNEDMKNFFKECCLLRKSPNSVAECCTPEKSSPLNLYDSKSNIGSRLSPTSVTTSMSQFNIASK